ncbi:hypothetical protein M8J76_004930 [Diaphorina citri]|nr:hypothetical protein M8J76_004930 [Diaphorina citri]KAI5718160.1 hypothetical protein M8J77_017179 [Diaphorina citri]
MQNIEATGTEVTRHTTLPLSSDDSNYIYGSDSLSEGGEVDSKFLPPLLPMAPVGSQFMSSSTSLSLNDIFIAVKTTVNYHKTRLPPIINTWFQLAKNQTWFFTDTDDEQLQDITNGHMINTKCHSGHMRKPLCCKTSVEFDTYLESNKK